jgi:hypothetical protein
MADTFLKIIDQALLAAVYAKFKDTLGITSYAQDTALMPKEVTMRHIAEKRGKNESEFISLWRTGTGPAYNRQRTAVARRGLSAAYTSSSKTGITTIKAVPADLEYRVWFWSKDKDKLNQITQDYFFWRQIAPNLSLNYNGTYPVELYMTYGRVDDESPVEMMYDKGLYFVSSMPINLEGWLFSAPTTVKTVKKIVVTVYDEEGDEDIEIFKHTEVFTA